MRFNCFYVENISIVYVTDSVLTYSLSYTRYTIVDHHDRNIVRTTRARLNECMLHAKTVYTHLRSRRHFPCIRNCTCMHSFLDCSCIRRAHYSCLCQCIRLYLFEVKILYCKSDG